MIRRFLVALLGILTLAPGPAAAQQAPHGTVRYYHTDALGSVRAVTDAAGQVVARHDYFPFGDEPASAPDPAAQRFTGAERDRESSMDYFQARYYMQRLGRFTTADPGHVGGDTEDPQSWNAYAYARNNPLKFTDPTGRDYEVHYGDGLTAYLTDAQFYGLFGDGVFFDGSLGSSGNIYINNDSKHVFGTYKHYYGFADAVRDAGMSAKPLVDKVIAPAVEGAQLALSLSNPVASALVTCAANGDCGRSSDNGVLLAAVPGGKTVRSMAQRAAFLRQLARSPSVASWMKQWLKRGEVPPGYNVDHIRPLSIGGVDNPSNMRLVLRSDHVIHHRYYRPW